MSSDQRKKTSHGKRKKHAETTARITDDEAEFWTNITPLKDKSSKSLSKLSNSRENPPNAILPDGDYFVFDNQSNNTSKEKLDQQQIENEDNQISEISEKNANETIENKQASEISAEINENKEISEYDNNKQTGETDIPFLDRLFIELTQLSSSPKKVDNSIEEQYIKINSDGTTSTIDINIIHENEKNDLKEEVNVMEKVRSFIDELNEEKDVIRGVLDEETFINRRSQKARASLPTIQDNKILIT